MHRAITFCFIILLFELPACCADNIGLQAEITAYQDANYDKVIEIGNKLIAEQPDNETARYYLANALSRLDLIPEAIKQYNFCATMSDDPTIRTYAKQALSVLNNKIDNTSGNQSTSFANPAHFAGSYQMNKNDVSQDFQTMKSEANQLDQNIEDRRHGQLVGASYAEDTRIDSITARTGPRMMGGMPYYGNYGYGSGYGGGNMSYGANGVPYLAGPAQFRVDGARHYFGQVLPWQINRSLDKQEKALNDSIDTVAEQLQGKDNGDGVRLSAQDSNLYVRNYIDSSSSSPPEPPVVAGLRAISQYSQTQ